MATKLYFSNADEYVLKDSLYSFPNTAGKGGVNSGSKEQVFVQTVMVRGLCSQEDWKFPIFVDFDRKALNHDLLVQLINKAEEFVEICGVVFDVEKDADLIADLGLTEDKTWFSNPRDSNRNVYCFADMRSIIKMQTDALLDEGKLVAIGNLNNNIEVTSYRRVYGFFSL